MIPCDDTVVALPQAGQGSRWLLLDPSLQEGNTWIRASRSRWVGHKERVDGRGIQKC